MAEDANTSLIAEMLAALKMIDECFPIFPPPDSVLEDIAAEVTFEWRQVRQIRKAIAKADGTVMTADPYRFWYAALALVGDCGKLTREQVAAIGPVHEDEPRPGFYRKPLGRKASDGFLPVAIWISDEGEFVALEDGLYADPFDVWTWVCRHPVTEATYYASLAGEAWPKREDAA